MDISSFIKSAEYKEFKEDIMNSISSLDVDTTKDDKTLAREVHANKLAEKKILKFIKDFESRAARELKVLQPYR